MIDLLVIFSMVALIIGMMFVLMQYEAYLEFETIVEHQENKTVFHNKDNKVIKCTISDIYWRDYINQRIELDIMYPSGGRAKLLTTISEFYNLWDID